MESKGRINALKVQLALIISDVAQSIAFYEKLSGIKCSRVRYGYAKFDVQDPALNLTLKEAHGFQVSTPRC